MYNELINGSNCKRLMNEQNLSPNLIKIVETFDTGVTKEQKSFVMNNLPTNNYLLDANICLQLKEYNMAREFLEKAKLELNIITNLTGKIARARFFCDIENAFLVLDVNENNKGELYKTERHDFVDFYVQPLSLKTQAIILTELEYMFRTTIDQDYKIEILRTYVDRLKYAKNEKNFLIDRLIRYYESFYDFSIYYELDKILEEDDEKIDIKMLQSLPIICNNQLKIRLAYMYSKSFLYNQALPLYKEMKMFDEVIQCYIGLDMEQQAKESLLEETKSLDITIFSNKIKLQEIYLLLATLCKDVDYYDLAFKTYQTSEAKRLKALFLMKTDIKKSIIEFEEALSINRTEKILFSYACALKQDNNLTSAAKIFKELLFFDPNNYKILINIAICYFGLKDYKSGIENLRCSLMINFNKDLVKTFVKLCFENEMVKEIEKLKKYYMHNKDIANQIETEVKQFLK